VSSGGKEAIPSLVSVVIPAHNSAPYLPEALETVFSQSYPAREIIVVDDGSTDETESLLRLYDGRITALRQENRGPSAARNAAIRRARGEYVAFLDADDRWNEDKLRRQVEFLKSRPHLGLVFSDMREFSRNGVHTESLVGKSKYREEIMTGSPIREAAGKLMVENFIPTSAVTARRSCLVQAGLFDEKLRASEDRELWSRVAALSEIACMPVVLGEKRVHGFNSSSNAEVTLRSRIRMWEGARGARPGVLGAEALAGLLAEAYLSLGYILLTSDRRDEARRAGMQSLKYAAEGRRDRETRRQGEGERTGNEDGKSTIADRNSIEHPESKIQNRKGPYPWALGLSLVALSFVYWPLTRSLWRLRNNLLGR
jgi:glycosyltransferase involved in cell wall biosynthesis